MVSFARNETLRALNCSQCGAPLTGHTCNHCGTEFTKSTSAGTPTLSLVDESPSIGNVTFDRNIGLNHEQLQAIVTLVQDLIHQLEQQNHKQKADYHFCLSLPPKQGRVPSVLLYIHLNKDGAMNITFTYDTTQYPAKLKKQGLGITLTF